ncbi:MAG: metal-dependent hydrolase [Chloroflexi bacterium]|nr:metal-dependent hydrolase [Chloroflexota bacterium]
MKLLPHTALSTAAGGLVWAITGEPASVPIAIAAGVLPDVDHLVDYYVKYVRRDGRFQFLLLHGWEYLLAGLIAYVFFSQEPWLLAAVAGYATQIAGDQLSHDRARWNTYLVTARAINGFRAPRHGGWGSGRAYQSLVESVPFGREALTRWFERRLPEE